MKIVKEHGNRQNYQRDYLINGISNANNEDLILFSDVDENSKFKKFKKFYKSIKDKIGIFDQKLFYYKLNLQVVDYDQWEGTRICKKKYLKSFSWLRDNIRLKNLKYSFGDLTSLKKFFKVEDGGWHFSFLGNAEFISSKIKSYVHSEYDQEKYTKIEEINERIKNAIDPYDRKRKLLLFL